MRNTPFNVNIISPLYRPEYKISFFCWRDLREIPPFCNRIDLTPFVCFRFPIGLRSISLVLAAKASLSWILSRLCLKLTPSIHLAPVLAPHCPAGGPTSLLLALLRRSVGALPLGQSQLLLQIQQFGHLGRHHLLRRLLGFERSHLLSLQRAKVTEISSFSFSC